MYATAWHKPFFSGVSVTSESPYHYPVALSGRPYLVDLNPELGQDRFAHDSIPLLRPQQDTSASPGEQSINPQSLWRRAQDSWHHGAGQRFYDRKEADPDRFRSSKGVDPWTRWELSLLNAVDQKLSAPASNVKAVVAGPYLYHSEGTEVFYTQDATASPPLYTATNVAIAEGSTTVQSLASDGYNLYAVVGDGIHVSTRGSTTWTHYGDQPASGSYYLAGYVKGRLMAADRQFLYNLTASGAAPTTLNSTFGNSDFRFTAFAEGPRAIYAVGYSGDKSLIFRINLRQDSTGLDAPVVAGELPDGEIIHSAQGYLGYLLLGTSRGLRFCILDDTGNIQTSSLIPTESPVYCFEAQGRFVYYGLTNYDGVSTGLGRLDLTAFPDPATPAYASDLMASGQGTVTSVVTFQDRRIFTVNGLGMFVEDLDTKVPSGSMMTGAIGYNLGAPKVAIALELHYQPLQGIFNTHLTSDYSSPTLIATTDQQGTTSSGNLTTAQARAELFEVTVDLVRSTVDVGVGPVLTRITLMSNPPANIGKIITVPLILHERLTVNDSDIFINPGDEFDFLEGLRDDHNVVTYQEGLRNYNVSVEDVRFLPHKISSDRSTYQGLAVVRLKTLNRGI